MKQIFLLSTLLPFCVHAFDFDPFATQKDISISPSKSMILSNPLHDLCPVTTTTVIDLSQAVEQVLCHNPQTRQAWAAVKVQDAQVGVAKSAYLPTMSLSGSYTQGHNNYLVQDTPALNYNSKTISRNFGLNANWVLFDFGLRQANLDNARQLLIAANATEDATLQTVFITAAQAYYDVLSAQSALNAYSEAEKFSGESFKAADAQYRAGAGSQADKLQAQTNFAQARLDRVKALGDLKIAQGVLALAMGMDANTSLTAKADENNRPDMAFVKAVDQLILEAKRAHPSIIAA
ncbi:MAG: TolC family protein [Candidatus Saccharibacteria bacterium]|nr:TolC family protein [Moraxellaceae bacterium]